MPRLKKHSLRGRAIPRRTPGRLIALQQHFLKVVVAATTLTPLKERIVVVMVILLHAKRILSHAVVGHLCWCVPVTILLLSEFQSKAPMLAVTQTCAPSFTMAHGMEMVLKMQDAVSLAPRAKSQVVHQQIVELVTARIHRSHHCPYHHQCPLQFLQRQHQHHCRHREIPRVRVLKHL
jgi:hypothetical protein